MYKHEKVERNENIRRLFYAGMDQVTIGGMFGLTQCRISAIVHRRSPKYWYCKCGARLNKSDGKAVCDPCRTEGRERREAKRALNTATRAQKRAERIRKSTEAHEATAKRAYLLRVLKYLRQQLHEKRILERHLRKEEMPKMLFKWQSQGRERVRYMVRARDNHTCQDCGEVRTPEEVAAHNRLYPRTMKSLDVHHLEGQCGQKSHGYDSIKDMDGLITLCHKCHFGRHDFNGHTKGRATRQAKLLAIPG